MCPDANLFPPATGLSSEENILALCDKEVLSGFLSLSFFLLSKDRVGLWYPVSISLARLPRHTHPAGFVSLTSSYVRRRWRGLSVFPPGPVSTSLLICSGLRVRRETRGPHMFPAGSTGPELGHAIMPFFFSAFHKPLL